MRVGIIADTHGLLRPEAVTAFEGCGCIIHAGDVGKPQVLERLRVIAPLTAIRGNVDRGAWADQLPETETLFVEGVFVHVLHSLAELALIPPAGARWVIISGHSHKPCIEEKSGGLWINPGSAGPRRFRLPITVALMEITEGSAPRAWLVDLTVPATESQLP